MQINESMQGFANQLKNISDTKYPLTKKEDGSTVFLTSKEAKNLYEILSKHFKLDHDIQKGNNSNDDVVIIE